MPELLLRGGGRHWEEQDIVCASNGVLRDRGGGGRDIGCDYAEAFPILVL